MLKKGGPSSVGAPPLYELQWLTHQQKASHDHDIPNFGSGPEPLEIEKLSIGPRPQEDSFNQSTKSVFEE